jgi:hypothetical protein
VAVNHDERTALARAIASVLAGAAAWYLIWRLLGWWMTGAIAIGCCAVALPDMCRPRWWFG